MNKHTPGPWTQEHDGAVVIGRRVVIPVNGCGPDGVSRKEREANARLIAAAPDLLAACNLASKSCGFLGLNSAAQKNILSAIAKAEGTPA